MGFCNEKIARICVFTNWLFVGVKIHIRGNTWITQLKSQKVLSSKNFKV
jgi:hypothetical protein